MSRPTHQKHHPEDAALYRRLVEEDCRVRIMGPSPALKAELGSIESVTLLPPFAQEAHLFLQGLDCFFYRTSEEYLEPWGRVVTEAMACGLPVVCHKRGGYAEIIDHGRNGFLFDTQQEALEILLMLKEDLALRGRVGKEARRTAEELFSRAAVGSEIVQFYLSGHEGGELGHPQNAEADGRRVTEPRRRHFLRLLLQPPPVRKAEAFLRLSLRRLTR